MPAERASASATEEGCVATLAQALFSSAAWLQLVGLEAAEGLKTTSSYAFPPGLLVIQILIFPAFANFKHRL